MSLLDPNITNYVLKTEKKLSKKATIEDKSGNILGHVKGKSLFPRKFSLMDELNSTVLLIDKKPFSWKLKTEIRDSNNNLLGTLSSEGEKDRLRERYLVNSNNDEILRGGIPGFRNRCEVYDSQGNIVAQISKDSSFLQDRIKEKKNFWILEIMDKDFDRKILLGFFVTLYVNYTNQYLENFFQHIDY